MERMCRKNGKTLREGFTQKMNSEMQNVIMILSNSFRPDLRVYKEAKSLIKKGYQVRIIAWDRECKYESNEKYDGIILKRVKIHARYGTGIVKFNKMFLFWLYCMKIVKKYKFSIIHCHDLDTLVVGIFMKLFYGKRLIYDSHENFSKMILMSSSPLIAYLVEKFEKLLLLFVDYIIVASSIYGSELQAKVRQPIVIIGNWQERLKLDKNLVSSIRKKYKNNYKLLIIYIGGLNKSRCVIPMMKLAETLPEIRFVICGGGPLQAKIAKISSKVKNVTYLKVISQSMVPYYTAASDVVYYVMNYATATAKYNAPNSLGFALVAGKPVIASDYGELGKVVRSQKCGVIVQDNTETTLRAAVQVLLNKQLLKKLQRNARYAGERTYNWQKMEEKLYKIYEDLVKKI